jgi:hypothetical protein
MPGIEGVDHLSLGGGHKECLRVRRFIWHL